MALSNKEILEERKRGSVAIYPFRKKNLSTSSYDVTLGEHYFQEQPTKYHHNIYNIYNKEHLDHVWGKKWQNAERAIDVFKKYKFNWNAGIGKNDKIILLQPGETILGHTNEFIGGRKNITTMMKARSSMGRNFIEVCKCAGWGDVGYINRWTMEITNNSQHYAIPVVVGRRIAQIIFFRTGGLLESEQSYTKKGNYASTENLKKLQKTWKPSMMLPRLYKSKD